MSTVFYWTILFMFLLFSGGGNVATAVLFKYLSINNNTGNSTLNFHKEKSIKFFRGVFETTFDGSKK